MLFSGISEYFLEPQALNLTWLLVWLFHLNQEHLMQQTYTKRVESLGLGLYRHLLAWQVQIFWGILLKDRHRVEIWSALIQIQQDHRHGLCCVSSCDGWTIISTDDGDDEETGRVVMILALWSARKRMCNVCEELSVSTKGGWRSCLQLQIQQQMNILTPSLKYYMRFVVQLFILFRTIIWQRSCSDSGVRNYKYSL